MQVTYYGYNALKYISLGSIGAGILAILFSIFNTSSWLLMLGLVFGAMFVFSGIYFYYALGWCEVVWFIRTGNRDL